MKITKQARREAKEVFRACCVNGLLDEDRVRNLTKKIVETKPRGYLAILSHLQRLVKFDIDRRTARVESATPLAADQQAGLKTGLSKLYGSGLALTFSENPALIGGLRIKVGSDVYDGSVQARLAALQESL
jgi:F-type H+-transporting ATPase subunit delta